MNRTKTAVLIHGCHVDSKIDLDTEPKRSHRWDELAIGPLDSPLGGGRATYGVLLAAREEAEMIIFGTGASQKNGVLEAKYTHSMVCAMDDWFAKRLEIAVPDFHAWLDARVQLDCKSQNTQQELETNLRFAYERWFRKVILVTNGFHASRAYANAVAVRARLGYRDLDILVASPDDETPPPVIFEPPSRGDRSTIDLRPIVAKLFQVPPNKLSQFLGELNGQLNGLLGEH